MYAKIKDIVEKEQTKDVEIKNLQDLVGQIYTFWCARYIYHGKVKSVNSTYITLEDAGIVYNTGSLDAVSAEDLQGLPHECQIVWGSVESFTKLKW